ncbi:T9SS type A sorting domain-containing protein [uncultured Eudoraea sp.]|uniref:T9SS type A sorting domain-containing protein n=1 Tax=uncultured Eudoraea sp. TaxID=1035614 RepID=UPI0026088DDC|nr:T9SS type A sorting domain-containing protein [uncultured Eudoraea sp.]
MNNLTGDDKEIAEITAEWPGSNGNLTKVWLTYDRTSNVIWQGSDDPSDALLNSSVAGWNGATLLTGEAILRFDFKNKVASSPYTVRVLFTDGTFLDISVGGGEGSKNGTSTVKADPEDSEPQVVVYEPTTLSAYPSPFTTQLNVDVKIDYEATVQVQLFDITGRLVKTLDAQHVSPGNNQLQFNIYDQVEEAIYVLKVNTGREIITAKVVGDRQ